jgi:glutaredoxin
MVNPHLHFFVRVFCAGVLALACTVAAAQTYRWTDPATGRTIYSDFPPTGKVKDLARIGAAGANNVEVNEFGQEVSFAARQAAQKYPVVLYTGAECPPCTQARELLSKRGVPFTEKTVQTPAEINELKALIGDETIPSLKVGSQKIRGFEPFTYNNVLDLAGYPKASGSGGAVSAAP